MSSSGPRSSAPSSLPEPPAIVLRVTGSAKAEAHPFLVVRHRDLEASYPDGSHSETFPYDHVERRAMDAVVLVAFRRTSEETTVFVRSAVRPPLALREGPARLDAGLWEVPAGLIEPDEEPIDTAVREAEEELGFRLEAARFVPLGSWVLPCPGVIAERQYFFAADVAGEAPGVPTEDGSPLERGGRVVECSLTHLLQLARDGSLHDAKTELALRRLADHLSERRGALAAPRAAGPGRDA